MNKYGRRDFAKIFGISSLGLGFFSFTTQKNHISQKDILAQDYTVAIKAPGKSHNEGYIYFNAFVKLSDRVFIASAVIDQPNKATEAGVEGYQGLVILSRSDDGGKTWKDLKADINFGQRMIGCILFYYQNILYMFTSPLDDDGIINVFQSKDEGMTWSDGVEVIRISKQSNVRNESEENRSTTHDDAYLYEGQKWIAYCQQSMVIKNGQLFFAVSEVCQNMAIVSCDLANGLLNPSSWRISNTAPVSIPKEINPGFMPGPSMSTLEGNIIEINGQLRLIARQVVDRYGTSNIAAIFDVNESTLNPMLSFTQFFPIPGAHGLFTIVYDRVSRLFWMASNLESNSQNWAGKRLDRDRRFLMLWYSLDALNWFPAGCIAAAKKMQQTFNYPSMIIDGDDLAIVARSTLDSDNYSSHDADSVTFHRIHDFRSLALDIYYKP